MSTASGRSVISGVSFMLSNTRSAAPIADWKMLLTRVKRFTGANIITIAARTEDNSPAVSSPFATRTRPYHRTAATPIEVVISIIAAFIGTNFGWRGFDILQTTLYSVFVFVFMIQGLCVLMFWLSERKMSKAKSAILIIIAVVFLQTTLLPIVGLLENVMGIRKRMQARKANVK